MDTVALSKDQEIKKDTPVMEDRPCEDGSVDRCHANIVAENIHSRIDSEGCSQCMLAETLDHKSDGIAIKQAEGFVRKEFVG